MTVFTFSRLIRVRQSLKTHQPVDELKKGAFTLQARVLVYRKVAAGVEVDICLSAISRSGNPVWESVLTFLSQNKLHKASRCSHPVTENESECVYRDFFLECIQLLFTTDNKKGSHRTHNILNMSAQQKFSYSGHASLF